MRKTSVVVVIAVLVSLLATSTAMADGPTCSDSPLNIDVHGEHVTRDYVGMTPGESNAKGGAETPGGPGPGFHFINGFAPGASFCVDANSGVIYDKNPNLPLTP